MQLTLNFAPITTAPVTPVQSPLRQAIDDFVHERGVNWREASKRTHRTQMLTFARWLERNKPLITRAQDITYRHIADYLASQKDCSWYTRKASYSTLGLFFRWVKVAEVSKVDVFAEAEGKGLLKMPRKPREVVSVISGDVVRRVIEAASAVKSPIAYRDSAIMRLMATTGIRPGELTQIRLDDCYLSATPAAIRIDKGKGGDSRFIYPTPNTLAAIKKWLQFRPDTECDFLFVEMNLHRQGLTTMSIRDLITVKWAQSCGVQSEEISPRKLRKWFATQAAINGMPHFYLKQVLGHDNVSTTDGYVATNLPFSAEKALQYAPEI